MGTFTSPEIVREVINRKGTRYDDDPLGTDIVKIVQYTTPEGDPNNWGCVYMIESLRGMGERYDKETELIRNPQIIWTKQQGLIGKMP
jgi:hypothetical protein